MSFNFTTTIQWETDLDQNNPDLTIDRNALIDSMVAQGKTDGEFTKVNDVTTIRHFIDNAAAEEFIASIQSLAATHSCTIVSAVVGQI